MNGNGASDVKKSVVFLKRKTGFSKSNGNGTPTMPIIMSNPGAAGYRRYLSEKENETVSRLRVELKGRRENIEF